MNITPQRITQYWRSCVADSTLGKGRFRERDLDKLHKLSKENLRDGNVGAKLVNRLFYGTPENVQFISIRFWPRLAARKRSHGSTLNNGLPEYVAPIVTEGQLSRNGNILPGRSVITRDVLEPLPEGAFSIGQISDLDEFLTAAPFRSGSAEVENNASWQSYRDHSRRMLDEVIDNWPKSDDGYKHTGTGLLELASEGSGAVHHILKLYDVLLKNELETPLLNTYAGAEISPPAEFAVPNSYAACLGHSNDSFSLADNQRDVLNHLHAVQPGQVLAVNGPPGTGKTTMLLSAIAGEWVRAALEEGNPPIIVAASSNNQAVTNIIDAFGKDFSAGKGLFAGRWLPDISSFGLFLPAKSREAKASQSYQTESFFQRVETEAYFRKAEKTYFAAALKALPDLETKNLNQTISVLHELIKAEVLKLTAADSAWDHLNKVKEAVLNKLGDMPKEALNQRKTDFDDTLAKNKNFRALQSLWDGYLANESILFSLFNFLPPVAKKRQLKAHVLLSSNGYSDLFDRDFNVDTIGKQVQRHLLDSDKRLKTARSHHELTKKLVDDLNKAHENWTLATKALGVPDAEHTDFVTCDRHADITVRFHLFLLATHYWEGRWLLEMEKALPTIEADQKKTGQKTIIPRWYRRMMLTPCAVSTFASLPSNMSYSSFSDGEFNKEYLLNFIDLLIVDEAGQVLPEIAGASFALAKKALVIGDTQQIEPISSLPKPVDIGNLQESGLLAITAKEEELQNLADLGILSTSGSAMHVAQTACFYHPHPELERGLYLFEHRRCYDEIINYCNALCYKGTLKACRGSINVDAFLPALGYLHIDGSSTASGGSRSNPTEAKTIAAWLAAHRLELEQQYGKPLEKLVGIITPFGKQVREIRQACLGQGISVDSTGMTIGTVHSLQGAERPIVIFSPVYSKHADGQFIDKSTSMLNVAVSRAKDSFLVFGDIDLFSTARPRSPRAVLASFLHTDPKNALEFEILPREDLSAAEGHLSTLRDAKEHDTFLLEILESDAKKICVVSPWIILSTMEKTGILEGFKKARQRGAEVEIFVDPELTDGKRPILEKAEVALKAIGIELRKVRQLHSKIVVTDDDMLCVGSFNWLSADRDGKYARHETSLVYRGAHLSEEIQIITDSLKKRQIANE